MAIVLLHPTAWFAARADNLSWDSARSEAGTRVPRFELDQGPEQMRGRTGYGRSRSVMWPFVRIESALNANCSNVKRRARSGL